MCTRLSTCVLELKDEKPKRHPGEPLPSVHSSSQPAPRCAGAICFRPRARHGGPFPLWRQTSCFLRLSPGLGARWLKAQRWLYCHEIPSHVSSTPVVVESDFVKYEGKFENHVSGTIGTALGKVKLNVGGKGLVESQSSFGTLRKQEVDLQPLLGDAVDR